ncbi:hypothetical protein Pmar_PMAR003545 [Perkinsus marinus ATCC 50983]|uniref:FAD dependent oxidoreductase domain-containing protein n=1 Tax=Perkinsus marinus (strain ATCC 50983 / TXsc) TaxID=423536 RepID=C5KHM0_PERM5|nr:hypothetical protein Pmar_PMAR003545 [Perkinsus marinus ATCC 50983]EER16082.1 hypothetical protein Pmar_PMAR003545 [Perkinsus marinus ATCC 50983]|eukprot:XP_002784286.1 hypothetical protein Pmar_PMAR003545 [Perkinsus marinus ATCC 50983]
MPVVIVGGGIMAASTAYYLATLDKSSIIIEQKQWGAQPVARQAASWLEPGAPRLDKGTTRSSLMDSETAQGLLYLNCPTDSD